MIQINRLPKVKENRQFSLYEENKAEAVQDTQRPKPYKIHRGQSCMGLQLNKFAETHQKKKREGDSESKKVKRKRREKTRMSFSPPSIWRYEERDIWYLPHRKRMIWPARRSSTSKTRVMSKSDVELRRTPRPRHASYLGGRPSRGPQSL